MAPSWHESGEGKAWLPEKELRWNPDLMQGAGQVIRGLVAILKGSGVDTAWEWDENVPWAWGLAGHRDWHPM